MAWKCSDVLTGAQHENNIFTFLTNPTKQSESALHENLKLLFALRKIFRLTKFANPGYLVVAVEVDGIVEEEETNALVLPVWVVVVTI